MKQLHFKMFSYNKHITVIKNRKSVNKENNSVIQFFSSCIIPLLYFNQSVSAGFCFSAKIVWRLDESWSKRIRLCIPWCSSSSASLNVYHFQTLALFFHSLPDCFFFLLYHCIFIVLNCTYYPWNWFYFIFFLHHGGFFVHFVPLWTSILIFHTSAQKNKNGVVNNAS